MILFIVIYMLCKGIRCLRKKPELTGEKMFRFGVCHQGHHQYDFICTNCGMTKRYLKMCPMNFF